MFARLEELARALRDGPAVIEVTATAAITDHDPRELAEERAAHAADTLVDFGLSRERLRVYALLEPTSVGELRVIPLYTQYAPPWCPPPAEPE